MRLLTRFVICGILLSLIVGVAAAQDAPLASGDDALVLVYWLPVHTSPDADSPIAAEMVRGMDAQVIAVQADKQGNTWYYLTNNAYGWVPSEWNGESALTQSSDSALQQIVAEASDALTADPQNLNAYIGRGEAYQSLKSYDLALADYTQAINLAPDDGRLYELRGDVYLDQVDGVVAQADFEQAIKLGRTLANTYNRLGVAYLQQGIDGMALGQYLEASSTTPEYGLPYNNMANAYLNLRLEDKAMGNYGLAISHDPFLTLAYDNRGLLYENQQNYQAALQDYNQALEIFPEDYGALVARAGVYEDNFRDFTTALADLNRAIELQPDISDAYVSRSYAYRMLGHVQEGIDDLKQAVKLNPTDDDAYYNLASVYGHAGLYDEAITAYNRTIEIGDNYDVSVLLYRAQVYVAMDDDRNALADLDAFLTHNSRKDFIATAHFVRGSLNLRRKDYESALADFKSAFEAWPEFAQDYQTYGPGYWTAEPRIQLIADVENRFAADSSNADLMLQLGALYMEYGHWNEGLAIYRFYLDSNPDADLQRFVDGLDNLVNE
ncbi:MAG: tetratricopeptide repeat protein [Chloroflexota bacterium]